MTENKWKQASILVCRKLKQQKDYAEINHIKITKITKSKIHYEYGYNRSLVNLKGWIKNELW